MAYKIIPEYCIFTDATADFSEEMMVDLPRVRVVPMTVSVDDDAFLYGPKGNLSARQFYGMQRQGKFASTSQINEAAYRAAFEDALREGRDVLYLGFSSGMSGTLNAARLCMETLRPMYPQRRLISVDTLCASVGEGFLVREAARMQYAGMGIEELAAWVGENRLKVCHWFTVDTLEHLRHGGRISPAAAAVGSMLSIKPLLHVDREGRLQVVKKPRGRRRAIAEQVACIKGGWTPEVSPLLVIGHGDDDEGARMLREAVLRQLPQADVHIADIGPIIGAHTGPGMLALIYWGNNR